MDVNVLQYGYVYRVINNIDQKTYIGKHRIKTGEPWLAYLGSGRLITAALKKYGRNSFSKELLAYGATSEEFSSIELNFIQKEIKTNKGEYNIFFGNRSEIQKGTLALLEKKPILDWYFEEKISTRSIAERVGCSQPLVVTYLNFLRGSDPRFEQVRERVALQTSKRSEESIAKQKETFSLSAPIVCDLCGKSFKTNVFQRHQATCKTNFSKSHLPDCETCGVKLSKKGAKRCKIHERAYLASAMVGNTNASGNVGGKITAHKRWHQNRGAVSPDCEYCSANSNEIYMRE